MDYWEIFRIQSWQIRITIEERVRFMESDREKLEDIYQKLQEDHNNQTTKKWNEGLVPKFILIFPILIFVVTYLRINIDKSMSDLFSFILLGAIFALSGVFINYLLSKKD